MTMYSLPSGTAEDMIVCASLTRLACVVSASIKWCSLLVC